jgi:hypothetical protein
MVKLQAEAWWLRVGGLWFCKGLLARKLQRQGRHATMSFNDLSTAGEDQVRFHVRDGRRCGLHSAAQSIATWVLDWPVTMFKCRSFTGSFETATIL